MTPLALSHGQDVGVPDTAEVRAEINDAVFEARMLTKIGMANAYDSARQILERTRDEAIETFGPMDTSVASVYYWLGICKYWLEDYAAHDSLTILSQQLYEAVLGPDHPALARPLTSRADAYSHFGDRKNEAEELYLRAIEVEKNHPLADSIHLGLSFNNLGLLYVEWDRFREGNSLLRIAKKIWTEAQGPDSTMVGNACVNLGYSCRLQGKYDEAERYLLEGERIARLNPDRHEFVTTVLGQLGVLYHQTNRLDEAESAYNRVIEIREQNLGKDHSSIRGYLRALAAIRVNQGRLEEAKDLDRRAIAIVERTYGKFNANYFSLALHLAKIEAVLGDDSAALDHYNLYVNSRQKYMDDALTFASESLRLKYAQRFRPFSHSFIDFAVSRRNNTITRDAFEMVLRSKGIVVDLMAQERASVYCSEDEELVAKLKAHTDLCSRIANITLSTGSKGLNDDLTDKLTALYMEKDRMETELSRQCSEFAQTLAPDHFSIDSVADALPDRALLVEFTVYSPQFLSDSNRWAMSPQRYASFTLGKSGHVTITDHGSRKTIDSLIEICRTELNLKAGLFNIDAAKASEIKLLSAANQLRRLLLDPIEPTLPASKRLIIAPDANLHLLPFEILADEDGRYAIEDYQFSYVLTGRDILKFKTRSQNLPHEAYIVACPDYESYPDQEPEAAFASMPTALNFSFTRSPVSDDRCLAGFFDQLPATYAEGTMIRDILANESRYSVQLLTGIDASEDRLKSLQTPPRILHLATHGYFCSQARESLKSLDKNPLVYSGLALAGANNFIDDREASSASGEDGILTSLEASSLNLYGTELVVLSACQTGIGSVITGEGVFGLRRAFVHAGARALITSMFAVPDKSTADLMSAFYTSWLAGDSKSTALHKAALSQLLRRRTAGLPTHPAYWGGFIIVGNPE